MLKSPATGESRRQHMPSPNPTHSTFTIGTLALRTGVPVKTIRYYSDQGLLPPAKTDETGYRRYTETDLARLETIRTLRGAGFSLKTIRALLDRELDLISATRLQLQTLRAQERTIRRQRTLLERALDFGDLTGYQENDCMRWRCSRQGNVSRFCVSTLNAGWTICRSIPSGGTAFSMTQ